MICLASSCTALAPAPGSTPACDEMPSATSSNSPTPLRAVFTAPPGSAGSRTSTAALSRASDSIAAREVRAADFLVGRREQPDARPGRGGHLGREQTRGRDADRESRFHVAARRARTTCRPAPRGACGRADRPARRCRNAPRAAPAARRPASPPGCGPPTIRRPRARPTRPRPRAGTRARPRSARARRDPCSATPPRRDRGARRTICASARMQAEIRPVTVL